MTEDYLNEDKVLIGMSYLNNGVSGCRRPGPSGIISLRDGISIRQKFIIIKNIYNFLNLLLKKIN